MKRRWQRAPAAKRALDLLIGSVGLAVTAPVLAVAAATVRICAGPPVLFRQTRVGLHGKPFVLYKLRTMTEVPAGSADVEDAQRMTHVGAMLRRTSMDELPELFNVLIGDMSLVGPRPLLPRYLDRYTPEQARRHEVKPGITGWAQVNGRNALTWEEKFALDTWYVDHRSTGLDLKILWMTLVQVVKREGISAHGHATMPEFMGTQTGEEAK